MAGSFWIPISSFHFSVVIVQKRESCNDGCGFYDEHCAWRTPFGASKSGS
jgi:hypothetical protein